MPETSQGPAAGAGSFASADHLALYELQRPFVEPLLRLCRLANTTFDILFYDVGVLTAALLRKGTTIETGVST